MVNDLRRGALFALCAAAAFAVTGALIKTVSTSVGNEIVVLARNLVGFCLLLPWAYSVGGQGLRTRRLGGHLWRSACGLLAMYCFFYALAHLHLAEAMLLTYSTPLYIPFIAWVGLGEKPSARAFPAALLGLVGIAFIVKPTGGGLDSYAGLAGAVSGFMAAFAMVTIRRISDTEPAPRIVFYFAALSTLISLVPMLWAWKTPTAAEAALLLGVGVFATIGQLCLTRAYSLAPAAYIGPFTYLTVLFAAAIGWLIWNEQLDRWSALGITLVIATCLLVSWKRSEPNLEE